MIQILDSKSDMNASGHPRAVSCVGFLWSLLASSTAGGENEPTCIMINLD